MANHDISWVLGAHVRFGSLDFIVAGGGELSWSHAAIQSLPSNGLYHERLGRQLDVSHGPWESRRSSIASPLPTAIAWRDLLERGVSH